MTNDPVETTASVYGRQAGGRHPNGMLSCLRNEWNNIEVDGNVKENI